MLHMLSGTVSFTSVVARHIYLPRTTTPCDDHFGVKTFFRYRALLRLCAHSPTSLLPFSLVTLPTPEYAQKNEGQKLYARARHCNSERGPCNITNYCYSRGNIHYSLSCGPDMKLLFLGIFEKVAVSGGNVQKQPEIGQSGGKCSEGGKVRSQGEIVHSSRTSHSALRPALTSCGHHSLLYERWKHKTFSKCAGMAV